MCYIFYLMLIDLINVLNFYVLYLYWTTDVWGKPLTIESKTIISSFFFLWKNLTKLVFLFNTASIYSSSLSSVVLTKFSALFIPIDSVILFHISLHILKNFYHHYKYTLLDYCLRFYVFHYKNYQFLIVMA